MRMNAGLILGTDYARPVAAYAGGQLARAQADEYANTNALRGAMQQHGAGALAGNQNALAAIAAYDPAMAFNLQSGQAGERRADAELGLRTRQVESGIAEARQRGALAAQEAAARMSAEELAERGAEANRVGEMLYLAAQEGEAAWDRANDGTPYDNVPFANWQTALAEVDGVRSILLDASKGSDSRASLNPIWGTDASGGPAIMQLSDSGKAIPTEFPEGFSPNKATDRVDAGTEWILLDPVTRQPVGRVPKNNFEAAEQTAAGRVTGESIGTAVAELGAAEAKGRQAVDLIGSIIADPALPGITGMIQGRFPPLTQGGTDLNVKVEHLKGKAFLEAFESLKGGGAITEREGAAATAAMARLDRAQSTPEFMGALVDLQEIMRAGVDRMRSKAAQGGAPVQPPAPANGPVTRMRYNPETGEIE